MSTRINLMGAAHGSSHETGGSDVVDVLSVGNTNAFYGASPDNWVNLDLSSHVGAGAHLVGLSFACDYTGVKYVSVRTSGDTANYYNASNYSGVQMGVFNGNVDEVVLIVATDAVGGIHWKTSASYANMRVDILWSI